MMNAAVEMKLPHLLATDWWLRRGEQAYGMYYDLDSAILKKARVDDSQFVLTLDQDGDIIADISINRHIRDVVKLNELFFSIWALVSFEFSSIEIEHQTDKVIYHFV